MPRYIEKNLILRFLKNCVFVEKIGKESKVSNHYKSLKKLNFIKLMMQKVKLMCFGPTSPNLTIEKNEQTHKIRGGKMWNSAIISHFFYSST